MSTLYLSCCHVVTGIALSALCQRCVGLCHCVVGEREMVGARVHRCCCEEAYKVQGMFYRFPFLRLWLTTFLYPVSMAGFL